MYTPPVYETTAVHHSPHTRHFLHMAGNPQPEPVHDKCVICYGEHEEGAPLYRFLCSGVYCVCGGYAHFGCYVEYRMSPALDGFRCLGCTRSVKFKFQRGEQNLSLALQLVRFLYDNGVPQILFWVRYNPRRVPTYIIEAFDDGEPADTLFRHVALGDVDVGYNIPLNVSVRTLERTLMLNMDVKELEADMKAHATLSIPSFTGSLEEVSEHPCMRCKSAGSRMYIHPDTGEVMCGGCKEPLWLKTTIRIENDFEFATGVYNLLKWCGGVDTERGPHPSKLYVYSTSINTGKRPTCGLTIPDGTIVIASPQKIVESRQHIPSTMSVRSVRDVWDRVVRCHAGVCVQEPLCGEYVTTLEDVADFLPPIREGTKWMCFLNFPHRNPFSVTLGEGEPPCVQEK